MYIQEIIIDGFKSYAQKTVVSGFDPQFNAITGLNGTGKSNILDSICFVLGISNLSQVRIGNLQELVYKQGQAGVTKATVSIVFNNKDPSSSPVGYENSKEITVSRQVAIGGKNKYMINGHVVQQSQVQNLFHSVQLNVNNPHFLIMQGRITKVLNMKPIETLSMIEEAAGTRMYETKKQAAEKTIEKKQLKVDEITKCINEEITPTLENLRSERQDYHKWQANNAEFERLDRIIIAYDYRNAEMKIVSSEADRQQMIQENERFLAVQEEMNQQAEECTKKITEIERVRDSEMEGELSDLKHKETDLSKDLVKLNTLVTNQKESIASEKETVQSLTKQIDAANKSSKDKQKELDASNVKLEAKETEVAAAEKNYTSLQEKYQNACAGVADETSAELLSLPEQVSVWERKDREAQSQLKQIQQKAEHATQQLKELKKSSKSLSQSNSDAVKEMDSLRSFIKASEDKLGKVTFTEANETALRNRSTEVRNARAQSKDQIDSLSATVEARMRFEFKDPDRGFDRSSVKGRLAQLFRCSDASHAVALELAAGGKLFQVVVDTEVTAGALLKRGQLKTATVFVPLSKISTNMVPPQRVARAKQIAQQQGGSAFLALELVQFEEDVRKAMQYTFGSTIICSSSEIAKLVAFDKDVRVRTISLDGDTYDPAGTLTGGSKNQLGVLLNKMEALSVAKDQYNQLDRELREIETKLKSMEREVALSKDLTAELEIKVHALKLAEEKIADSSYSQCVNDINAIEKQLTDFESETKALKQQQEKAKEELKKLKLAENNFKKARETAMKDMESAVRTAQKAVSALKAEVMKLRSHRDALMAEMKSSGQELTALKEQCTISENASVRLAEEANTLTTKLNKVKADYDQAKQAVAEKTAELNKCSKEIKALEVEREKHLKDSQNASLEARKIAHKLKQWDKDFKDASKVVTSLIKQYPWIEKEKAFFGQSGSDFDFAARDMDQCAKKLKEVKAEQDKLSKKINKKVMGMIENAETEYEELNRKREVILNDKAKIESVIEELDVKKSQALQTTWVKVNRDFGSIFSMLLPGTTAKLEPLEGCTVMEGLEVKVAFNGVWKESLTELSGGQRSLLALSLILALLLFKPAPMYILDEVDAALDLSHTQNIGMMLRTHFSTSQFIVVSLKEGMFNNANVIFRTKFVDGVSAVTRTVAGSKANTNTKPALITAGAAETKAASAVTAAAEEGDEDEAPRKKKGKSAVARIR